MESGQAQDAGRIGGRPVRARIPGEMALERFSLFSN